MNALQTIWRETIAGFDWLVRDLDVSAPVSFVPNPGNIGDALINLACYRFSVKFETVLVCPFHKTPDTEIVFIGGGGNLVEGRYEAMADFLERLRPETRIYAFPVTLSGYRGLLDGLEGRIRVLCREAVSFEHVRGRLGEDNTMLSHDAAFFLADRLREMGGAAIRSFPKRTARFYRTDAERLIDEAGDEDVTARDMGACTDFAEAERVVKATATRILHYGRIHTDRLHCAILSAMLDRTVVLRPNAYYKNEAVFDHSLSRLTNVRFQKEAVIHG